MDVIHFPEDVRPARWSHPVLALGNFDGVHRGHRKILDRVLRVAHERGLWHGDVRPANVLVGPLTSKTGAAGTTSMAGTKLPT